MLDVLEKHKLIGGSGGSNTLTYLETTDADFNEGELSGVLVEDNKLLTPINKEPFLYFKTTTTKNEGSDTSLVVTDRGMVVEETPEFKYSFKITGKQKLDISGGLITRLCSGDDYTIDFQLKTHSRLTPYSRILDADKLRLGYYNTENLWQCQYFDGTSQATRTFTPTIGEWQQITLMRKDGVNYFFVDGVLIHSIKGTVSTFTEGLFRIGYTYNYSNDNYYNGSIAHFRIFDMAIFPTEGFKPLKCDADYTKYKGYRISPTITRPTKFKNAKVNWEGEGSISIVEDKSVINDSTIFYLDGNEFKDKSPKNATITNSGATINAEGKFDKCIDFTNGKLTFTLDGSFVNKDFTIDWWEYDYYNTVNTKGVSSIFNNSTTSSGNSFGLGIVGDTSVAGKSPLRHGLNIASSTSTYYLNDWLYGDDIYDRWVHRALVRKDNVIYAYEDGKLYNTAENIPTTIPVVNTFQMGRWRTNTINTCKKISEFRVSNKAMWHSEFTPSSHSYIYYENTKISKGELIKELPANFSLKEEVKDDETISNVSLEMRSKLGNFYMSPKEDEDTSKFYLYNEGDECTDITGGLVQKYLYNGSLTKNSNHIYMKGNYGSNGGYATLSTTNTIELTRYTKLCALVDVLSISTRGSFRLYVKQSFGNAPWDNNLGDLGTTQIQNNMLLELDVTNFTGNYFVSFGTDGGSQGSGSVQVNVHKLWLEK